MKFVRFLLIIVAISSSQFVAMKKTGSPIVIKPIAPADEYYTKANLEALQKQGIQNHVPLLMLIDQDSIENPKSPLEEVPLTQTLFETLPLEKFPILLSVTLLVNLIARDPQFPIGSKLSEHLNNTSYDLYDAPSSQFILLIPKKYSDINPNNGMRLNTLTKLSNLLPNKGDNFNQFLKGFRSYFNPKKRKFKTNDLNQIFIHKKENPASPIFDIWAFGHGWFNTMLTGLTPQQANEMLRFFDLNINTGVVLLQSCYISGKNMNLLQFKETGIAISHNYILIVDGIAETFNYKNPFITKLFLDFFNNAALLQDRGESLSRLLKDLNIFHEASGSPHGAENIPQIWLPNGLGFQTFNIDERILTVGNVLAKVHAENKTPIIAQDKEVVLVYPTYIKAPLQVGIRISLAPFKPAIAKIWKNLPMINEQPFGIELLLAQFKPSKLTKLIDTFESVKKIVDEKAFTKIYLFPTFISMHSTQHIFTEIKVDNRQIFNAGVMRFIRDAFLSMPDQKSTASWYIDRITGYNDISIILAAVRLFSGTAEHPLEKDLMPFIEKNITLEKVIIRTDENANFYIAFIINGKAWQFSTDLSKQTPFWNFREYSIDLHNKDYKDSSESLKLEQIPQKSISETLKQKQQEMIRKKTALIEKQKAISEVLKKQEEMRKKAAAVESMTPATNK